MRAGVWTPSGEVLCDVCAGRLVGAPDGDATVCDLCGVAILVRDDVAWLNNLCRALERNGVGAAMQQTGGMTACLFVDSANGREVIAVSADDETPLLGTYANEAAWDDGEGEYLDLPTDPDAALAAVLDHVHRNYTGPEVQL